jgi:hypothetical protein
MTLTPLQTKRPVSFKCFATVIGQLTRINIHHTLQVR